MSGYGAFGKIPALGDFIRLKLEAGFVSTWDGWLQEMLPKVEAALGDRWQECYLSAPIWRFTLAPGLAGAKARIGIFMASVDRVGRQFPLTLAAPLPDGISPAHAHFESDATFERLEDIAIAALEDETPRDTLETDLGDVPAVEASATVEGQSGGRLVTVSNTRESLRAHLAGDRVASLGSASAIWSSDTGIGVRLLTLSALPNPAELGALFDLSAPLWLEEA